MFNKYDSCTNILHFNLNLTGRSIVTYNFYALMADCNISVREM